MGAPPPLVIDTNVFAVAEEMHDGARAECVAACLDFVRTIDAGHRLLVDEGDEILAEYLGTLASARRAGLATKLVKELWRTRFGGQRCHRVAIQPLDHPAGSYSEVPTDLRDFDTDDQKFIAVAAAVGGASPIIAGLDGEWWDRQGDFTRNGLSIQFPCLPALIGRGTRP